MLSKKLTRFGDTVLFHMAAKEKPKTEEPQPQEELRKEIRKEWSAIEPKLIEINRYILNRVNFLDSIGYPYPDQ